MGVIADKLFAIADDMEKKRLTFEKMCEERDKNIEKLLKILVDKNKVV